MKDREIMLFQGDTIQHIGCDRVPQRGAMRVGTGVFDP